MRLLRLELGGFKSFAKNTILEFPHAVTAVVGPNGSGKSNVADAIRWVLGEQSIKSLRGKRGEDLIFSGSASAPRLSKAGVSLIFDNRANEFSVGFDEVSIGRRVYRDGSNEYLLQGSEVRLKDIVELLAKVGIGSSQHHIIGQGEADRILYASPRERREMIEDALGLKIFQIKRAEAERKFERTEENMRQVSSLRKEIQPHLKFLKSQAEKYEVASKLRADLKSALREYLSGKSAAIRSGLEKISGNKSAPFGELKKIESEISKIRAKLAKEERRDVAGLAQLKELEMKLTEARKILTSSERDVGRLEGMVSLEEKNLKGANSTAVSKKEVEEFLDEIRRRLEAVHSEKVVDKIRQGISELVNKISEFLAGLGGSRLSGKENLEQHQEELLAGRAKLEKLRREEAELSSGYNQRLAQLREEAETLRREERQVYELESAGAKIKDALRSFEIEEEKIRLAEAEFKRELEEARPYLGEDKLSSGEPASPEELETSRKKTERLKIRLEEAGGIDPAVLKEFEEVSKREEFLSGELGDLVKSAEELRALMKELEDKIEHDFEEGISKINDEFGKFFRTMFGGGKAALKVILMGMRRKVREESEEENLPAEDEEVEAGIEISVDLPRKRIKSLDMLSGGERALTSIALLFAMSAVHPPPFLVLDETDAALDEANSERYAKMLEGLSKTTQLIVITHNRATMKCAGILYGVTMGSDGISKLLSLKFEEAGALVG